MHYVNVPRGSDSFNMDGCGVRCVVKSIKNYTSIRLHFCFERTHPFVFYSTNSNPQQPSLQSFPMRLHSWSWTMRFGIFDSFRWRHPSTTSRLIRRWPWWQQRRSSLFQWEDKLARMLGYQNHREMDILSWRVSFILLTWLQISVFVSFFLSAPKKTSTIFFCANQP